MHVTINPILYITVFASAIVCVCRGVHVYMHLHMFVCAFAYVWVHVYVHVCVYVCVCMLGQMRLTLRIVLNDSSLYSLSQGLSVQLRAS